MITKTHQLQSETLGTLDLKIAQLESHLQIMEQRRVLSAPYPDHQAKFSQRVIQIQFQLQQLLDHRNLWLQQHTLILPKSVDLPMH